MFFRVQQYFEIPCWRGWRGDRDMRLSAGVSLERRRQLRGYDTCCIGMPLQEENEECRQDNQDAADDYSAGMMLSFPARWAEMEEGGVLPVTQLVPGQMHFQHRGPWEVSVQQKAGMQQTEKI